jgi:hypothetical protein
MILTVDLAAKFSAAILRDRAGKVHLQFDSRGMSHFAFAAKVGRIARDPDVELVVIEEVPFNPRYTQVMVKPVFKFQGVLLAVLHPVLDKVLMLDPSTWMRPYPGVQRAPKGYTKTAGDKFRIAKAAEYALSFGYTPPDLVQEFIDSQPEGTRILKKHTNPLEKSKTDYVSAFLMNHFVTSMTEEEFRALPSGVQPAHI